MSKVVFASSLIHTSSHRDLDLGVLQIVNLPAQLHDLLFYSKLFNLWNYYIKKKKKTLTCSSAEAGEVDNCRLYMMRQAVFIAAREKKNQQLVDGG